MIKLRQTLEDTGDFPAICKDGVCMLCKRNAPTYWPAVSFPSKKPSTARATVLASFCGQSSDWKSFSSSLLERIAEFEKHGRHFRRFQHLEGSLAPRIGVQRDLAAHVVDQLFGEAGRRFLVSRRARSFPAARRVARRDRSACRRRKRDRERHGREPARAFSRGCIGDRHRRKRRRCRPSDRRRHVALNVRHGQRPVVDAHLVDGSREVLAHTALPPMRSGAVEVRMDPVALRVPATTPLT